MNDSKVVIVTAAGRGMGAAIARELAARGWKLALMSLNNAADIAREVGGVGMEGSVAREEDLHRLVDLAMATYGRVDAVVNNTGHPPKGDLLALDDASWQTGMDMLLLNVVRMMRKVTPILQAQGGGSVVNISSYAADMPEQTMPVSSVLRAALSSFTRLYAERHAADKIRMNAVLPGFVDSWPEAPEVVARIPMQRFAKTKEIAQTVAFLLSDESGYITGQNLRVDGGIVKTL